MIGPDKRSAADLAVEYGVSVATIYGWKAKLKNGTPAVMGSEASGHERSPSEKLMLLLEARNIAEENMGEWLRRNGLHSQHPELWEQELKSMVDQKGKELARELKEAREEIDRQAKEIGRQAKEIRRKDKALAEMSTIITLQKKHHSYFRSTRTNDPSEREAAGRLTISKRR